MACGTTQRADEDLLDPIATQLVMQGARTDAEKLRRLFPVGRNLLEGLPDDLLLNDVERNAEGNGHTPLRLLPGEDRGWQMDGSHDTVGHGHNEALGQVSKLPDVPRPCVFAKGLERRGGERLLGPLVLRTELLDERD